MNPIKLSKIGLYIGCGVSLGFIVVYSWCLIIALACLVVSVILNVIAFVWAKIDKRYTKEMYGYKG